MLFENNIQFLGPINSFRKFRGCSIEFPETTQRAGLVNILENYRLKCPTRKQGIYSYPNDKITRTQLLTSSNQSNRRTAIRMQDTLCPTKQHMNGGELSAPWFSHHCVCQTTCYGMVPRHIISFSSVSRASSLFT